MCIYPYPHTATCISHTHTHTHAHTHTRAALNTKHSHKSTRPNQHNDAPNPNYAHRPLPDTYIHQTLLPPTKYTELIDVLILHRCLLIGMYNLTDLNGGGELVELMKKANRTKNFKSLDDKIQSNIKQYLYNDGKGQVYTSNVDIYKLGQSTLITCEHNLRFRALNCETTRKYPNFN